MNPNDGQQLAQRLERFALDVEADPTLLRPFIDWLIEHEFTPRLLASVTIIEKLVATGRGFNRTDFQDANGDMCSLQESSVATQPMIWLGQNHGTHVEGQCLARMHLTQEHVKALLPYLIHFAETGELEEPAVPRSSGLLP